MKARDLIARWPQGPSTSRLGHSAFPRVFLGENFTPQEMTALALEAVMNEVERTHQQRITDAYRLAEAKG